MRWQHSQGHDMKMAAARKGDMDTGDDHPPRANTGGSASVFINGIPAHREGDAWPPHPDGMHPGSVTAAGSATVFANGQALARMGDSVSCGSVIAQGSPSVFAG